MENQTQTKEPKKMTKAEWIALAIGLFVVQILFKIGDFGLIPALIITFGSFWIVKMVVMYFTDRKTAQKSIKDSLSIIPEEYLAKLQKRYSTTGIWSMALAVVGFVSAMAIGFKPEHFVSDAVVALVFAFPRFYFGLKLKNDGIKNLQYALNLSLGMLIYSILVALVNLISFGGWLYWILIYFYFKSYRETKIYLANTQKN